MAAVSSCTLAKLLQRIRGPAGDIEQKPGEQERIVLLIVQALLRHHGGWPTFRRLSHLMGLADHDGDSLAGFAEYRSDLFVIARDKMLKLQPRLVKEIARIGVENWRVPERPHPPKHVRRGADSFAIGDIQSGPCYCHTPHRNILYDLKTASVPGEALLCDSCWREMCRVRGIYFNAVDSETWKEICRKRGYLRQRQNPRGF